MGSELRDQIVNANSVSCFKLYVCSESGKPSGSLYVHRKICETVVRMWHIGSVVATFNGVSIGESRVPISGLFCYHNLLPVFVHTTKNQLDRLCYHSLRFIAIL